MTIRENLLVLIEAVENEPEQRFSLCTFEEKSPCGTLHCTLGLATTLPHFYMQGLEMKPKLHERAAVPLIAGIKVYEPGAYTKLDALFGESSYTRLFAVGGDGEWDQDLQCGDNLPDKELALARLRNQLELYP